MSVFSFVRYAKDTNDFVVVILNLTPIVHHNFMIGVPQKGKYIEVINSDKAVYGGSNMFNGDPMFTSDYECNGLPQSIELVLSPLSITILKLGE
jgi:1,4-alpha-glucan branching enzyme